MLPFKNRFSLSAHAVLPVILRIVMPPALSAATPVGAVMLTWRGDSTMNPHSSVVLPVPPAPVRNTF